MQSKPFIRIIGVLLMIEGGGGPLIGRFVKSLEQTIIQRKNKSILMFLLNPIICFIVTYQKPSQMKVFAVLSACSLQPSTNVTKNSILAVNGVFPSLERYNGPKICVQVLK